MKGQRPLEILGWKAEAVVSKGYNIPTHRGTFSSAIIYKKCARLAPL